ncbi:MAG: Stress responsive Barrel Domain [Planctomycetota bacterium]|jgi:hypothetical protein
MSQQTFTTGFEGRPLRCEGTLLALAATVTGGALLAGCGGQASPFLPEPQPAAVRSVAMPGRLQHVVLVELSDKSDIAAMKADSDLMLPRIPTVRGYVCGAPVDIGRATVAKDYDLGIVVQFDSVEDYQAYLVHPIHEELVSKWRPKWRRFYIVDFAP